ncbi:hypothetical protein LX32DRAFT_349066 [Colletotrichum zoysiae]|uniref:Secreted protein n=1 Tax=Colletotrichum zoysiae TaxID=1216348 RepID=A0AAD9M2K9_9PEZI|nr:hypothetical protein LX32DRAFT_349066 [Colletotrichum zoysiae]
MLALLFLIAPHCHTVHAGIDVTCCHGTLQTSSRCALLLAAEMIKGTYPCLVVPARAHEPRQNTVVNVPSYDWRDISLVSLALDLQKGGT